MADPTAELVAEQLRHLVDGLRNEIAALRSEVQRYEELASRRLECLEAEGQDHEERLRALQDGVTSFKVWSGLASGGSGLVAVLAMIREFLK